MTSYYPDPCPQHVYATFSDIELTALAREGEADAFEELCRRFVAPAWQAAYAVAGHTGDAEDAVADGFARLLRFGRRGGVDDCQRFGTTVLKAVRAAARDTLRRSKRSGGTNGRPQASFALPVAAAAFRSLPERWRSVLWLTYVERLDPTEVGVILGVSANGLAQLALRARAGLRERYLHAQLASNRSEDCKSAVKRLGSYVAAGMSHQDASRIDDHLQRCGGCRQVLLDLDDLTAMLNTLAVQPPANLMALAAERWRVASDAARESLGASRRAHESPSPEPRSAF
jgi:DNA-directed RNA polymerase specialized sigma24 family protein